MLDILSLCVLMMEWQLAFESGICLGRICMKLCHTHKKAGSLVKFEWATTVYGKEMFEQPYLKIKDNEL